MEEFLLIGLLGVDAKILYNRLSALSIRLPYFFGERRRIGGALSQIHCGFPR